MSKLIPTLFLKLDLELTDPSAEWKETCWYKAVPNFMIQDSETNMNIRWFVKQEGLHVILKSRWVRTI